MTALQREYAGRARFFTVYIKEAHTDDEWQMKDNETQGVCYRQPRTLEQRLGIARDFVKRFRYEIPLAVDRMENGAEQAYAAWPERLFILDEKGTVVYKGKPGPFGYHPEEVAAWLAARFKGAPTSTGG
jgi:type I thyroxine 5'-deiodinase